ncbi:MAG TPA: YrdB family protein [Phototrophicaceae bacterium]|nr:YrdB family protein [Phototrophicaceae bacterium]
MSLLKNANLGLAFLLELTALGAFAFWGFVTGSGNTILMLILGIGTPVVGAAIWGIFAAPMSERRLSGLTLIVFKLVFFGIAALALLLAGSIPLAVIFAVLVAINTLLAYAWDQENVVKKTKN